MSFELKKKKIEFLFTVKRHAIILKSNKYFETSLLNFEINTHHTA